MNTYESYNTIQFLAYWSKACVTNFYNIKIYNQYFGIEFINTLQGLRINYV